MKTLPRINTAAILLCALSLSGCMGYRLGSMLPPDIQSVYVPTFINKTTEPMIEIQTTDAAIRQIQQDGSLRVKGKDQADTILEVVLTSYTLSAISYDKDQLTTANEYRIRLTATVVLKRIKTDEIVVENPGVWGESTFLVTGDLTTSKQNGLPAAAEDLGHHIVEQVVEAWQ